MLWKLKTILDEITIINYIIENNEANLNLKNHLEILENWLKYIKIKQPSIDR